MTDDSAWTMSPEQEALALRASRIRQQDNGWAPRSTVAQIIAECSANDTEVPGAKQASERYTSMEHKENNNGS